MAAPLLIPAALSLAGTAFRGIAGAKQMRDARKALQGLEEPEMYVPSAIRQRAQEPIAREFMSAQEDAAARRTGQSVGALRQTGARGIIGGVGGVMDAERQQERQRMAGYEQERRGALGELGRAQENLQGRQMQNYLSKMQAATRALEAGQQNVAGAFGDVSSLGQSVIGGYLQGGGSLEDGFGLGKKAGGDGAAELPASPSRPTLSTKAAVANTLDDTEVNEASSLSQQQLDQIRRMLSKLR